MADQHDSTPWWIAGGTVITAIGVAIGKLWGSFRKGKREDDKQSLQNNRQNMKDQIAYWRDLVEVRDEDILRQKNHSAALVQKIEQHFVEFRLLSEDRERQHAEARAFRAGWERANAALLRAKEPVEVIPPLAPLEACEVAEGAEFRTRAALANTAIVNAASDSIRSEPPKPKSQTP